MGIPLYSGIKARVHEMVTHILFRQGQNQTNSVKVQDYGKSVLGPARCFAGGLHATRSNDQLRCLHPNSTEAPKSIAKQKDAACCQNDHTISKRFSPFRYLKHSGKGFSDNGEVKAAVNCWLSDQAADFFEEGFQNLVLRKSEYEPMADDRGQNAKLMTIC
ncbi:hypothetical protein TNCV_468691 [Trichonephila clavipes]|nr:hypothetical protein TNCV_468691 [Trichonephila clavipes]